MSWLPIPDTVPCLYIEENALQSVREICLAFNVPFKSLASDLSREVHQVTEDADFEIVQSKQLPS